MRIAAVVGVVFAAGCGNLLGIGNFHLAGDDSGTGGGDGGNAIDGSTDAYDGRCFGQGLIHVCFASMPTGNITLPPQIDTSNASTCAATVSQSTGNNACVIAGATITMQLPSLVTGALPLVLIATDTIDISQQLNASSSLTQGRTGAGANPTSCGTSAGGNGTASSDGGSGGGGGGLGATGGGGGVTAGTNVVGAAGVAATLTFVQGGCPGGTGGNGENTGVGGSGGDGGGAIYAIARTSITVEQNGAIYASAAGAIGGKRASVGGSGGGGGGGGGGLIGLEAPTITADGILAANGGGGSGGGQANNGMPGGNGQDGNTTAYFTPASGGSGPGNAGPGGAGAAGTQAAQNGQAGAGQCGGGGGGGGAGVIWVKGSFTGSQTSPTPTLH